MLDIRAKLAGFTVNTDKVMAEARRARIKSLKRAGALLRQTMRQDILRPRKRPSQPGEAPSVHTSGFAGLRTILFVYDGSTDSVVVGPVKLNQKQQDFITLGAITVPQLLNEGAVVNIQEVSTNAGQTWRRRDLRRNPRPGELRRTRRATYRPRPFVSLAYAMAAAKMPDQFADSRNPKAS